MKSCSTLRRFPAVELTVVMLNECISDRFKLRIISHFSVQNRTSILVAQNTITNVISQIGDQAVFSFVICYLVFAYKFRRESKPIIRFQWWNKTKNFSSTLLPKLFKIKFSPIIWKTKDSANCRVFEFTVPVDSVTL